MADRELRLRIGAAVDASFNTVMTSVVEAVKRARKQIQGEMNASARAIVSAQKQATKEIQATVQQEAKVHKLITKDVEKDVARAAKQRVALEKAANREVEADLRRHNAERARVAREHERIFKKEERDRARSQDQGNRDMSRRSAVMARVGMSALSGGMRLAGSAMHAFGLEVDPLSQIQASVEREKIATSISNQAWIPSGGPPGADTKVDPQKIIADATKAGIATGIDTNEILQGVEKYVSHTGDLETVTKHMTEIGKVAKANGSTFNDMAMAMSEIANEMVGVEDKGAAAFQVVRALAGQGQVTAIELRDQAKYVAMITSQSNFYKIDPRHKATLEKQGITDDTAQRMAVIGGLAQMARSKGGRVTARMAMQSSMAFMRDLANPTEIKRFKEFGLNVYQDAGHTQLRDPVQMILESFRVARAKGGVNRDVLNRIYTNQQSRAVANAFAQDYNDSYKVGADQGIKGENERHKFAMERLTDNFEKLIGTAQKMDQIDRAFADSMKTVDSQTKIFNNQMGQATDQLMKGLAPAILAMTPAILAATGALADFFNWLSRTNEKEADKRHRQATGNALQATGLAEDVAATALKGAGGPVKLTEQQQKHLDDQRAALEKAIAEKQQAVNKEEEGRRGPLGFIPGVGSTYSTMDDKALEKEAEGDIYAKKLLEDRKQLTAMKEQLGDLTTSLDKLEVLKGMGKLQIVPGEEPMKVEIVKDNTAKPPGVQPHTDGLGDVDSNSH